MIAPAPERVRVDTPGGRYDIVIGSGLLQDTATYQGPHTGGAAVVVTNPTVDALHGQALRAALAPLHRSVDTVQLPDGEAYKDWAHLNRIFDHLLRTHCDRRTVLYALGGGVVGDMTGFAAACFMRGVAFVQVPTTLLAQVDSSVGGKTAVNHPAGKNMIGAFHQPQRVVCDLRTLATLPARELRAGLAEVIKYGPIADLAFLDWLELHIDALCAAEPQALAHAVRRSCEIKARVVGADERESGLRAILNFGHTFGHAIEAGMGYGQWLHGEAVACGMVMASALSAELGTVPASFVQRMTALLQRAGLPVRAPAMPLARWFELMRVDKKAQAGEIRFVVLDPPGQAVLRPAPDALVSRVIEAHSAPGPAAPMRTAAGTARPRAMASWLPEGVPTDGRPPLAPWASHPHRSRGRRVPEPPAPPRNEHQRDRDRIVHSAAFRRLVYKTQVFVNHEGDLFRTRLTHSLEVAQLARSGARTLGLNEDLVEAIALAHDLGHTPFGHAGQDALHDCMRAHGGFEHNLQSLRVVDRLETRYVAFDGLNLTLETRAGILKRCPRPLAERLCASEPDGPARRFLEGHAASLEAQLVNVADEMAYNTHDIDDGLRSGLIMRAQLLELPLFARHWAAVQAAHPAVAAAEAAGDPAAGKRLVGQALRAILATLMDDMVTQTFQSLAGYGLHAGSDPDEARAVLATAGHCVGFSPDLRAETAALKRFLFAALYRHPQVARNHEAAQQVVRELFAAYLADPGEMPADYGAQADLPRAVADYIAGMTDRYALREHTRLTGLRPFEAAAG